MINGKIHREDGPAFEGARGNKEWWIDGVQLSEAEFKLFLLSKQLETDLSNKSEEKRIKI